jgi:hypothetical protein
VTRTVKVPDETTLIPCDVAPVDQRYVAPALEVRVTPLPAQKDVGPPGVITGCAGKALTVTETCAFTVLYPSLTAT